MLYTNQSVSKEEFMKGDLAVMASEITLIPSTFLGLFSFAVQLSSFLPHQELSSDL